VSERVVVVGATGFVGATVCARLRHSGYDVLALGRRPAPGVRVCDLLSTATEELAALLDTHRPIAVVNAAGAVWDCTEHEMEQLNVVLVERLVLAMRGLRRPARLIQLGSVHEYGVQPAGVQLAEDTPPNPNTPYGTTKLRGTEAVLNAPVDGVVLRVTNVIGAGAPAVSLPGRVAAELARASLAGGPAELKLSPLRAHRDFVDARDVADAVRRAVHADVAGAVINIGCGDPVPVRSIVDLLVEISGVPTTVVESGAQATTRSLALDWQQADVRRAGQLLGWHPRYPLQESLRELWDSVRPVNLGSISTGSQVPATKLGGGAQPSAGTETPPLPGREESEQSAFGGGCW
jgi:NDP-hexose 4-ketoreductase